MPPALTICQPFAALIIAGEKRCENRKWRLNAERFPELLIHAGRNRVWLREWDGPVPRPLHFGALLGSAEVVGVWHKRAIDRGAIPAEFAWLREHPHCHGPWCIVFGRITVFDRPIPYSGRQGVFDVPAHVLRGE